ncbi:MAG: DUF5309 domain-containing protein [Patescibacteria group bacterium]|nr:DUF5309 domain-containing protein [Patescibacteria group bacterium]
MAAPTNTFLSSAAVGNREDLSNIIYRIDPIDTPVFSLAAKAKATNTIHEWQTQALASAAANAQAEGDDMTAKAVTPTVRLQNRAQISTKGVIVSGTQQAMNHAGVEDDLSNQVMLSGLELRRDIELGLTQNDVIGTSPRQSRGLRGWITDNVSTGSGYVAPSAYTGTGTTTTTDGTQRAFTEALLKNVLQSVFTAGGKPDTIVVGPAQKQTFSTFTGNATRMDKSEDKKLYAGIDVYVSDFGELTVVPDRFSRSRDVFVLESEKLAVAYLRPMQEKEIAATGDSMKRQLIVEYTLECRAPKAHGAIYDVL